MAYIKNTWVDQDVERPKTYEVTNNQDGSITLTDSFGLVTELGTPVNAVNMNHIEDGINGCAIRKHNLTETFNLGEWVLGGTGEDEGIYKSLVANNVGNAITDDTAWENISANKANTDLGNIDASCKALDGQWIASREGLASNVSLPTSTALSYSLASYLPNDNYKYEVLITGQVASSAAVTSSLELYTDIFTDLVYLCRSVGNGNSAYGTCILPVGTGRSVSVYPRATNTNAKFYLYVNGYRRIGTNS